MAASLWMAAPRHSGAHATFLRIRGSIRYRPQTRHETSAKDLRSYDSYQAVAWFLSVPPNPLERGPSCASVLAFQPV